MSYKTILVFLEERAHCDAVLSAAVRLANLHEAHLMGVGIQRQFEPYVSFYADLAVSVDIDEQLMKHEQERLSELHAKFEAHTKGENFVSEWRVLNAHPHGITATLLQQAAATELLIIGAGTDTDTIHPMMRDRGALVAGCACPVLSLPVNAPDKPIGKYVLVAWDGSAQASRAVFSTLPILRKASRVWLHRINSPEEQKDHTDGLARDLANALSRKGLDVELGFSDCKATKVGKELMRVAKEHGADSIVMGAYAHSRLRDLVLGGATRHLLSHSTFPLFLAA